jgi:hypothetical protein
MDKGDNIAGGPFLTSARCLLICLALGISVLAVYWQVWDHSFVNYDDTLYVTKNPYVQAGLTSRGITWSLTATHAGNWHPLTWLSHMLDRDSVEKWFCRRTLCPPPSSCGIGRLGGGA